MTASVPANTARIGFVGLGNMGGPLCERLLGNGLAQVFDLNAESTGPFAARGANVAGSLPALADACNVVLLCLPTSRHVEEVIFAEYGLQQGLARGALVIDMTTGDPKATRQMSERLEADGIELIDAPVSGGPRGAREGTIAIMVGASEQQFARARPVLDRISSNVMHAGAVGAGHALKAGNNMLNLVCRLATFEVVSLLARNGVDPATATGIINKASGRNYATEVTLPDNILSGKMQQGFTMALMRKDATLALDIARASGVPMPIASLARETLQQAINASGAEADMSLVALLYEQMTGGRIRPPSDEASG